MLESLVGVEFLPKGPRICTRCPINISLRDINSIPSQSGGNKFSVVFSNTKFAGRRFDNSRDVKEALLQGMNELCGPQVRTIIGVHICHFLEWNVSLNWHPIGLLAHPAGNNARSSILLDLS